MATATVTLHGSGGSSGYDKNPKITTTLEYDTGDDISRTGSKLALDVRSTLNDLSGTHYFGYQMQVWAQLDSGTEVLLHDKPASDSQWSGSDYPSGWKTVSSINTTTSCKLKIKVKCNCTNCASSGKTYTMWSKTLTAPAYTSNYTVKYKANGGSGAPAAQTTTTDKNLTLSSTKPTRSIKLTFNANGGSVDTTSIVRNYTFVIWNNKSDGSGSLSYDPGASYTRKQSITLYAQWTAPTAGTLPTPSKGYIITYNPMGGIIPPLSEQKYVSCAFGGWHTSGGTLIESNTTVTMNHTLYAHWTNPNMGNLLVPTKAGCTFSGWYTDISYSTEVKFNYVVTGNMIIYAKWEFKITFNGNGGFIDDGTSVDSDKVVIMTSGQSFTIPKYTVFYPEDENGNVSREFSNWNTAANGTGVTYTAGHVLSLNGPLTLYAQYTINTYTVRWLTGYGSNSVIKSITVIHGTTLNPNPTPLGDFPKNPTRSGYSFAGWKGDWENISDDTDIIAMWGYSPIWIMTSNGWVSYEPEDPNAEDE